MAIHFGNDKIKEIYHGSDKIKEVYHGSDLVYTAHDPRGYWVHRSTGVKTYFGLDDPSIVLGIMSSPSWKLNCSEVKFPLGVTGLGKECFRDSYLTSINIPEGVTILENSCFRGCGYLTSITLPESVTSLGLSCFRNCTSLTLATVLPATPPSLGSFGFDGVHTSFNIKVPSSSVNTYKAATNWTAYAAKISAI